MKKEIMRRAWELMKSGENNLFAECLKEAWLEVKDSEWQLIAVDTLDTEGHGKMIAVKLANGDFAFLPKKTMRKIADKWYVGINKAWEYALGGRREQYSKNYDSMDLVINWNLKISGSQVLAQI